MNNKINTLFSLLPYILFGMTTTVIVDNKRQETLNLERAIGLVILGIILTATIQSYRERRFFVSGRPEANDSPEYNHSKKSIMGA